MPTQQQGVLELPGFKPVPWIVDRPDGPSHKLAVLLAHGAGGDASSGNLPTIAAAVAEVAPCLRFTARGGSLQHRINVTKALLAAAPTLLGLQHVERWVLAGHSMGARGAASIAGEQPAAVPVAACLLLSYPLHPPGKPSDLRDALLHQLRVPTLLVRGSKDAFSTQALWDAALQGMHAGWRQVTVEGGDHGLKVSGQDSAQRSTAALHSVCTEVQQFVREAAQRAQEQRAGEQRQRQQQQAAAGASQKEEWQAAAAKAAAGKKRGRAPAAKEAASKPKKAGKKQRRS
ncbi:Testis-expressed sequence 30 [Chlorella sorokiniana]|uniref:Testis-expressed sequence 30 n=1 Tax=Chlorella sorokiniana TaxID=3076 RepID=A0A2P6TSQ6_CHLSO|nr:Testis-expressed sequence 30 [Chlorella sorokiniana]|eukprot:PRW57086.1 Testis-expressed sequence 30 [Chlorella sorokiniana]